MVKFVLATVNYRLTLNFKIMLNFGKEKLLSDGRKQA